MIPNIAKLAIATFVAIGLMGAPAFSQEIGDYKTSVKDADQGDWLLADGRAISRTSRANLFDEIGTTFGIGDGSTTFNLPDARGRALLSENNSSLPNGKDSGLATRTIGDVAGAETHVLTIAEMPAHDHGAGTYTGGGGSHSRAVPE